MASNKFVTAEDAERIWFLHNKGLSNTEICGIENRSVHTVNRVVNIYKAVRDTNGVDELPPTYREGYQHLVGYARQHFGKSTTNADILLGRGLKPLPQETKKTDDLQDLLIEARRTNELLEKIIALWG